MFNNEGISGLFSFDSQPQPYEVKASVNENGIDQASSAILGAKNPDLFANNAASKELGKMDFLRLLTTQLQFQDPFEPMNNTEFVAQLAQFSALEGTNNVEEAIQNLDQSYKDTLEVQNFSALSMTNASAVSLIGKRVRIGQNTINFSGIPGEETEIKVHVGNSDAATVQILDQNQEIVRNLRAENKDKENSIKLSWDGKNDAGEYVQPGKYYLKVVGQEEDSSLYCFLEDMVQGVRYTGEGPLVKIGGRELPIGNIMDISMAAPNETNNSETPISQVLELLGKTVRYKQTDLTYMPAANQQISLKAHLGGFDSAIVQVKDSHGELVHSFKITAESGGTAHTSLDCIDFNQNGPYSISLAEGSAGYFYAEGTVNGLSTVDGTTVIRVNGITIPLAEVIDVSSSLTVS